MEIKLTNRIAFSAIFAYLGSISNAEMLFRKMNEIESVKADCKANSGAGETDSNEYIDY